MPFRECIGNWIICSFLFLWFIHSAYFSDYLLSNYHPPGILLLFSCPVVSESSRPHGPTISQSLPKFMSISYSDAIQPSYLLEKHQGLFQWVNCLHQETKVLEFSFSISPSSIQRWFPLRLTGLISLQPKGHSRVFSNTTVRKHQFFGALLSLWYSSDNHTWPLERP